LRPVVEQRAHAVISHRLSLRDAAVKNPFAQLVGFTLRLGRRGSGSCTAALDVRPELLNPNAVVHGGALFSMVDTVMGAALYTTLEPGENCATIEIKIHFLRPVSKGKIRCSTRLVQRGRRIAVLEAHISVGRLQVAQALGTFAIFAPRPAPVKSPVGAKPRRLSK
jgi:acyl-CoA thioesterase